MPFAAWQSGVGAQTLRADAAALSAPIVAVLLVVVPLVALLPVAAIAALLVVGASRTSRSEPAASWFAFAAALAMDPEVAVLAGVTLSLLAYLDRTSRPQIQAIAPDPRHRERRFAPARQGLAECPQLRIAAVEGSLCFGADDHFESLMDTPRELARKQRPLLVLVRIFERLDRGACALSRARVFEERGRLAPPV